MSANRHNEPVDRGAIRTAARLLAEILVEVSARVQPGVTGVELARFAEERIIASGGEPAFKGYGRPPFPAALCVSVDSCVVHGVPTDEPLAEGSLIGLDLGMVYRGVYTDMARTVILGPVTDRERHLVETAQRALDRAIERVRPGATAGDIGAAVQELVEAEGFGVVRDLAGHGVGRSLHEPPELPNFGKPGTGAKLESGMVLAIEPMITMGDYRIVIGSDQWSARTRDGSKTAHVEDMIEVTENGHSILTRL